MDSKPLRNLGLAPQHVQAFVELAGRQNSTHSYPNTHIETIYLIQTQWKMAGWQRLNRYRFHVMVRDKIEIGPMCTFGLTSSLGQCLGELQITYFLWFAQKFYSNWRILSVALDHTSQKKKQQQRITFPGNLFRLIKGLSPRETMAPKHRRQQTNWRPGWYSTDTQIAP